MYYDTLKTIMGTTGKYPDRPQKRSKPIFYKIISLSGDKREVQVSIWYTEANNYRVEEIKLRRKSKLKTSSLSIGNSYKISRLEDEFLVGNAFVGGFKKDSDGGMSPYIQSAIVDRGNDKLDNKLVFQIKGMSKKDRVFAKLIRTETRPKDKDKLYDFFTLANPINKNLPTLSKPVPSTPTPKPATPKPATPKPATPSPAPAPSTPSSPTALIPPVKKLKEEGEFNEDLGEVLKSFIDKSESTFFAYRGTIHSGLFYYMWVLERAKSDCALSLDLSTKIYGRKKMGHGVSPYSPMVVKEYANLVAEGIVRCRKRNKVLAIPITKDGHANMMIFNYHRKECERYEPNGYAEYDKYSNKSWGMDAMVKKVNIELRKIYNKGGKGKGDPLANIEFRVVEKLEVCPTKSTYTKYWKNHQGYEDRVKGTKMYENVLITESGGYCLAFSFTYLLMRLSNLKISPQETIDKSLDLIGRDTGKMTAMIRGQTKLFFEEVKKMVDKGVLTLNEVVKYFGAGDKTSLAEDKKVDDAIQGYLAPLWAKYTI